MEHRRPLAEGMLILVSIVMAVLPRCYGREFAVGGKDGWVPQPSECYNHWAERNRFQVNDTLYFKYDKGNDSVLVVSKNDYYTCNTANPVKSLTDGNSIFKFDHSGPFYFISGIPDHCYAGQRLPIVVLAIRPPAKAPAASPPQKPSPGPFVPGDIVPSRTPPPPSSSGSARSSSSSGIALVGIVAMTSIVYVMGQAII
ncbi:hypothetical protein MLD38_015815 [Melastoma candidum]|uniref:Uncharacterized protein n=1 Tax=Melastoma candidum TaxID=119954 RepID=A0ACB9RHK5_9MYRT|nr:hypothetical protein MLD38_015815 [Melastoma candidum]